MIKKLQIKFILVSMISVFFVLAVTIAALNIYDAVKIESDSKVTLAEIVARGPEEPPTPPESPIITRDFQVPPPPSFGGESYFIVSFTEEGEIEKCDCSHFLAMNEENVRKFATHIYGLGGSGKSGNLRYTVDVTTEHRYVACVDLTVRFSDHKRFMVISIIVSISAYVVLLGLIILASKIVFKPSEDAYRKQKEFITNASHELKTPLTVISTDMEIIELDHGKNEWTESIKDQVKHLTNLTNQLVTLAKLQEDNKDNFPFTEFDFSALLNETYETFKPSFKMSKHKISKDIEDKVMLKGNSFLINELFYILFDNAHKYMKDKGSFSVSLKKDKNIILDFTNDIDDNSQIDVSKLFDRFYRSPDSKTSGTGVGLSIVKEIVDTHNGKISAELIDNKINFHIVF